MRTNSINPREDLQTIREIMERSSKFLSLSGLSGIFAGVCALAGAGVAWFVVLDSGNICFDEYMYGSDGSAGPALRSNLASISLLVLGLALLGAFYFSQRKARKAGQQFWTNTSRRILIHLLIPLFAGGFFILILLLQQNFVLVASAMLIFYGLSLVNAGKFTFSELHYLGLTEIGLGILAGLFVHLGLLFWTIGFGLTHIVYGAVMYYRHER
jgi:hypothetical protein